MENKYKVEPIEIECPNCKSSDYVSFDEIYDGEWITLLCECLRCKIKYQINYRAVGIDRIKSSK